MSDTVQGLVRVERLAPQGMITLRGDLASTAVKNAATGVAGVDMPGQRQALCVGERGLLWMSPDELAVLLPHAEAPQAVLTMQEALSGSHALVADVSDARAHFRLSGLSGRISSPRLVCAITR